MTGTLHQQFQAGFQLHRAGRLDQAEQHYRQIVRVDPRHADALHLLGVIAHQRGAHEAAVEYIRQALELEPDAASYHSNLGTAYRGSGRPDLAVECYRKALAIDPDAAGVHYNLANALKDQSKLEDAVASYRRALEIVPNYAEAMNNLGDALKRQGCLDEAVACLCRAIQLNPRLGEAHFNLGNAYKAQERLEDAIQSYQSALNCRPDYADAHVNLGYVYEDLGQIELAQRHYDQALHIRPDLAEAHFNRALLRLQLGDFSNGWPAYEWRWTHNGLMRRFSQPAWDGSYLAGRRLLVHAEQGIGDEIMFAGCLPDVIERTAACLVECDPRLVGLFSRSFPSARVFARLSGDADRFALAGIEFDVRVAAGSLPRYLRRSLSEFPQRPQYLFSDGRRVEEWRRRLSSLGTGLLVGISWFGGKDAHVRRKRSTQLSAWKPLLSLPGVHYVNLQYGDCREELRAVEAEHGIDIHDRAEADPLHNVDDFAALISALDLVISVDNSTVHLAAALGRPVWVLLPFAADWRWLRDRADSPWYPTARLFRQTSPGGWPEVLARAADELRRMPKPAGRSQTTKQHQPRESTEWRP